MTESISVPLLIRDLARSDIDALGWSGGPSHLVAVGRQLARVAAGEADYLVACPPSGLPVGTAGIDYAPVPGTGIIHQVAVHGALQSCGIGTLLMSAAEDRISARGCAEARLTVEHSNPRARALYERLGYVACGDEPGEWDEDGPDGTVTRYRTMCTVMRKPL
jgi:ribosomal protein S18 acetylase RimI-like enzyme